MLDEKRPVESLEARPTAANEPEAGCPYEPRCPLAEQICATVDPALHELATAHLIACPVAARHAGLGTSPASAT